MIAFRSMQFCNIFSRLVLPASPQINISSKERKQPKQISLPSKQQFRMQGESTVRVSSDIFVQSYLWYRVFRLTVKIDINMRYEKKRKKALSLNRALFSWRPQGDDSIHPCNSPLRGRRELRSKVFPKLLSNPAGPLTPW